MLNACAQRPTVLVVSACYSGIYARPGITRPERIVMTASAADQTSFGCSNNNRYTFFDQCFLDAWARHAQWGQLADEVRRCVRATERSVASIICRRRRAATLRQPVGQRCRCG